MTESHVPSAEFRARLEEDVARTFRRDVQFADQPRTLRSRRIRGLLLLLAGMVLGAGTEFAAGQAQNAQERSRLIEAAAADSQLAEARVSFAQMTFERARTLFETGLLSRTSLLAAEADVRQARQRLERLKLDIAEISASAAPPRDELWAPLVGGRDFVTERLKLEAAGREQTLSGAEQNLREVERQVRVGVMGPGVVTSAEADVRDARQEMALLAKRLDLRRRFLDGRLDSAAIARELKRFEVEAEVVRATANLEVARERAAGAKILVSEGVASELDARRAELEVLELSATLKLLRSQLQEIEKKN